MKKLVLLFIFVGSTAFAGNLLDKLSAIHSYQATFTQTVTAQGQIIQQANGKMRFLRPGYFWWETLAPTHQIILADQSEAYLYDVDLAQVTKRKLSKDESLSPAELLSGDVKKILNDFTTKNVDVNSVELTPKKPASFKHVWLTFDGRRLVQMQMQNNLGQQVTYVFSRIRQNVPMTPKSFQLKLPQGVTVLQ